MPDPSSTSTTSGKEDPDVVGDFISRGMDELIDEEFGGKKSSKATEKSSESSERKSSESEDEKEPELDDITDGEEDTETEKEEDKDDDKDEEDNAEEDDKEKPKSKSAIATARADKEFAAILKKHPEIERDYFAGKEYGKLFESVEQAQEVLDTKEYIDGLVSTSLKGDPAPFLEGLYEASGENKADFARFIMNLLPTINEFAPKMAEKIIEKPIINLFAQLGTAAEQRGDDQLAIAVKLCMKELYGKAVIPTGVKIDKLIKDTRDVDRERDELNKTAEEDFYNSIQGVVVPTLENEISKNLSEDADVSDGIKDVIIEKTLDAVMETLNNDEKHKNVMKRLRNAAKANRYSSEYKRRVAKEVYDAAKAIIPEIAPKIERKVLGSIKKRKKDDSEDIPMGGRGNPNNNHGSRSDNSIDFSDVDFNRTSIRDALDFDKKKMHFKRKSK